MIVDTDYYYIFYSLPHTIRWTHWCFRPCGFLRLLVADVLVQDCCTLSRCAHISRASNNAYDCVCLHHVLRVRSNCYSLFRRIRLDCTLETGVPGRTYFGEVCTAGTVVEFASMVGLGIAFALCFVGLEPFVAPHSFVPTFDAFHQVVALNCCLFLQHC